MQYSFLREKAKTSFDVLDVYSLPVKTDEEKWELKNSRNEEKKQHKLILIYTFWFKFSIRKLSSRKKILQRNINSAGHLLDKKSRLPIGLEGSGLW